MPATTATETDVTFRVLDGIALAATLYRPAGPARGAVVDLHGGAWTSGDRTMNVAIARHLAASGIAVLSLDFRMPPSARYPATLTDVAEGVRWMKAHAGDVGTEASRVGLLGTSSGGHLALLAALRPSDERYAGPRTAGGPDISVPFVVLCWPVSDPVARYKMVRERANARLIEAHHAFWADEDTMAEGSPFAILSRGEAERLPPLLIVQGTSDDNLTPDMQERFAHIYRAHGGEVELAVFPGQVHGFIGREPAGAASLAALERITTFINAHVGA